MYGVHWRNLDPLDPFGSVSPYGYVQPYILLRSLIAASHVTAHLQPRMDRFFLGDLGC